MDTLRIFVAMDTCIVVETQDIFDKIDTKISNKLHTQDFLIIDYPY